MEPAARVAAAGSVPTPSHHKEWRTVPEQHSARNAADKDLAKIGQSEERTIYEVQQGRKPADVDFCSITMDGSSDDDILQQRLHTVGTQREELQQLETKLRAQMIARSKIMELQNNFDAKLKEHANAATVLQEQLHQKEQTIHELERKMEDKERELRAIKLDSEAAWAKDDLLREQDKELATFRRERDHSEGERAQNIKHIHDLQVNLEEKERQLIELQEQHRVAQDAIVFKEDQLREAHAWVSQLQQVEALQSHELRKRIDQLNQLWLGFKRQFAELERLQLQTQKLQLELAESRESGAHADELPISKENSTGASQLEQDKGNQLDVGSGGTSTVNSGVLPSGTSGYVSTMMSTGNVSNQVQAGHAQSIPFAHPSILGVPPHIPPGQLSAMHPFLIQQQGIPLAGPSNVLQSNVEHLLSVPAHSSFPQWQNQQTRIQDSHVTTHSQLPPSQLEHNQPRPHMKLNHEMSVNGQPLHLEYLDACIGQKVENNSENPSSAGEAQVLESIDRNYLPSPQPEQALQQISSQFNGALRLDSFEQNNGTREQNILKSNHGIEGQSLMVEQPNSIAASIANNFIKLVSDTEIQASADTVLSKASISTGQMNIMPPVKYSEGALLDERSLLACIVRTIPPGGKIQISSTLPNRLGKMLAPLCWHDYEKKYGKLGAFVATHPELFVIEGDYIRLREGAKEMIAATSAVAKVAAAAAAASSPYLSFLPSVAVTPTAQPHHPNKVVSIDSNQIRTDNPSQPKGLQSQNANGFYFGIAGGLSSVKILSKPKDLVLESGAGQLSVHLEAANGSSFDRSRISSTESEGSNNGRPS